MTAHPLPPPPKTRTPAAIERWLKKVHLESGGHQKPEDGACLMEAVAFMQGQPFGTGSISTERAF